MSANAVVRSNEMVEGEPRPEVPGFVLGDLLGRGANGCVYAALEEITGRKVALKWIPTAASDMVAARFEREVKAVASLRHPNVVALFNAGEAPGGRYLVLERVDGYPLEDIVESRSLGPLALASLMAKVARALEAAHAAGIVHRDVKPRNVLVDRSGEPKLLDFGLARLDGGAALTAGGVALGTLAYMAPEVMKEGAVSATPATDVFAIGAMIYEALSGRPPYLGKDGRETVARILEGVIEPLPGTAPRELAAICHACLEVEPTKRPSAGEVARRLEAFAAGEPLPGRAPVRSRTRLIASALAAIVALAMVGVIASSGAPAPTPSPRPAPSPLSSPSPPVAIASPTPTPNAPAPKAPEKPAPPPNNALAPGQDLMHMPEGEFTNWLSLVEARNDFAEIEKFANAALEKAQARSFTNKARLSKIMAVVARAQLLQNRIADARKTTSRAVELHENCHPAISLRYVLARIDKDEAVATEQRRSLENHGRWGLFLKAVELTVQKSPDAPRAVKAAMDDPTMDRYLLDFILSKIPK